MKPYYEFIRASINGESPEPLKYGIYPKSVRQVGDGLVFMADAGEEDVLVSFGCGAVFSGGRIQNDCTVAPLTHANADALRKLFPYAAPQRVLARGMTFGTGDRLGIAGDGFLRVFGTGAVTPVLAQQSTRELNLTGRTYSDVIDAATFSVFRCGYTSGWGADGDHLKNEKEIQGALEVGCTMITLDCSEHIKKPSACGGESAPISDENWARLRARFPAKMDLGGATLLFSDEMLRDAQFIYGDALEFIQSIYETFFASDDRQADFEISIDETDTPTTPEQHYFVAQELQRLGVRPQTLAPRFIGEFQKGVDYRGDIALFEKQFVVHCEIARHFGYKISVHSGSDKFSVFPLVHKYTQGQFHLKIAGTNWLEAMRLVAQKDPALYREAHAFALESFAAASKYYHVSTNLDNIPDLALLSDEQLPSLFDQDDARQLIHITYGFLLSCASLNQRLFRLWRAEREAYADALARHIGHHVALLTGSQKQ